MSACRRQDRGGHRAGPSWEFADGSAVTAKVAASVPGATGNDIAWLRLDVGWRRGSAPVSTASTVQRTNIHAGALSVTCETAGAFANVP